MNQNRPLVGLGILIFNDNNEILLGQRIKSHGAFTWAPPGGHLEFGENFASCASREVEEETGLIISEPTFFALTNDIFEQEKKHYVSIFMKVPYPKDQIIINKEPDKLKEWRWFSLNEFPEKLFIPLKNLIDNGKLQSLFF